MQLNIGLREAGEGGARIPVSHALLLLRRWMPSGMRLGVWRVVAGAYEDTLAVELVSDKDRSPDIVWPLAVALHQDCIAVVQGERGDLVGPLSEVWLPFRWDMFVDPTINVHRMTP